MNFNQSMGIWPKKFTHFCYQRVTTINTIFKAARNQHDGH